MSALRCTALLAFVIAAVTSTSSAWAQVDGKSNDINHFISAGAGIAHPSVQGAIGSNPAGQIYYSGMLLNYGIATDDSGSGNIGLSGLLIGGNGFFGATLGVSEYEPYQYNGKDGKLGNTVDRGTLFQAGWAGYIPQSRFSFGMSISAPIQGGRVAAYGNNTTAIQPLSEYKNGVGLNFGMIFDPRGPSRIGVTAYQLADKFDTLGFGFAHDFLPSLTFVLDGTYTRSSKSLNFVPAIAFAHQLVQASIGYGFAGLGDGWSWGREGINASIGFSFLKSLTFSASLYQVQKVNIGITARM